MRRTILLICICLVAAPVVAQQINLPAEISNEAALPSVMPRFAKAVIAFQQADQHPDLAALFKAQLVAGLYSDALATLDNCAHRWPMGREINYGTGKEVVDESIADAKTPLQISWFGGSYLDLPVRR
jgi:hypothetical protein